MSGKIPFIPLFTLAMLLLASGLPAQPDPLPRLARGRMDWKPYAARAPKRMNQKDYAVYMIRVNGLSEWFESEPDQAWINDFHFFDVNRDLIPDAVYSGATKYFKGDRTMLMFGDSSLKYPLSFSEPGYIHAFQPSDSGIGLTLVEEPAGVEFRVFVRRYFYDYAADSARMIWQSQYISTTRIPQYRYDHVALELQRPAYLRTDPEVRNEPAVDYDQDGRPDGLGNILAELKPGTPLLRVWEEQQDGLKWSFVMVMRLPEGKHLFRAPLNERVPSANCGWIPSEAIEN